MARALVTARRISGLSPIPDADIIEVAAIDGWQVVVKKGDYKEGDLVAFYEVDSFIPTRPEYEFLRKNCYRKLADGTEGFRLKTAKLRGQLSQGLVMPLHEVLPALADTVTAYDDLTGHLGVTLWEPSIPVSIAGKMKGNFPTALFPKTDEPRIQNCTRHWERMRESKGWFGREKLDGTSISMYWDGRCFGVCSRNWELKDEDDHPAWVIAKEHNIAAFLDAQSTCYALQGELIGPGIQKNRYGRNKPEWRLFSVFDIARETYCDDETLQAIADELGLSTCPLIYKQDFLPGTTAEILEMSNITSAVSPVAVAEGIVWRTYLDGERDYSFKAINNNFLLKDKD